MKPVQRIIKYLAIAFAIFLIINIFSAILFGIRAFADVLGLTFNKNTYTEKSITDFESNNITTLNINVNYSNLVIRTGEFLKAESSSNTIICKQNNNQLFVEEEKQSWFSKDNQSELIIYIPSNITFDNVTIEAGVRKRYYRKSCFKRFIPKSWSW